MSAATDFGNSDTVWRAGAEYGNKSLKDSDLSQMLAGQYASPGRVGSNQPDSEHGCGLTFWLDPRHRSREVGLWFGSQAVSAIDGRGGAASQVVAALIINQSGGSLKFSSSCRRPASSNAQTASAERLRAIPISPESARRSKSKYTAPVRRTARSTSERTSVFAPRLHPPDA
jgi:hypothetical protein